MFKIIFFLMNALDGSRLLNLVNSKWGGALCAIVLGVLLSCALAPFEIWPTAILAYSFLMMLLSVAKSKKKVFLLHCSFMPHMQQFLLHGLTLSWKALESYLLSSLIL